MKDQKKTQKDNQKSYRYDKIFGLLTLISLLVLVLMVYLDYGSNISSYANDELKNVTFSSGDVASDEVATGTEITKEVTVVVDPQLGGSSNGGTSLDGTLLKNQNLEMAQLVKEKLEAKGVTVVLTRDSDKTVSDSDRVATANESDAAVVVSLGRNVYNGKASGVESWIYSGEPIEAIELSNSILEEIANEGFTSRGIKAGTEKSSESDYAINSQVKSTSCIILLGFLDSEKDNEMFTTKEDATAQAIADGIASYLISQGY
ncbi:N-acetylmuramoyl-L-alanine amidase family protein [Lachnospira multipara]|uniref:N-acetylmuramoyl-L-alanine amidase n=1 Tax=Lachnospira multipara TaxID=28051 RepID=A0A1H5UVN3_9FIRM|nr:N-acetylmuramoyl-L-alanine amidase [Lachnospira multipara]SEF78498.1 N-acetylmuramoyl-L-alanine amidase [Lachnospira multipara]